MNRKSNILFLTQFGILLAIEAIFCFTPLGSLPAFGPIVATLGMIPVVITAILLGTGAGTLMGFFAGLFSFLVWTFAPPNPLTAFVFTPFHSLGEMSGGIASLFICFVPRILVGTVAALVYRGFTRLGKKNLAYWLAGICGSMVNTLLVMGGIYIFFGQQYMQALDLPYALILTIIGTTVLTSGIPEAIISAVAAFFVCRPIQRAYTRRLPE